MKREAIAFLFSLFLFADCRADTVTIGVIAPLTGVAPTLGQDIQRTAETTAEVLAAQKTRFQYVIRVEDGRCAADTSPLTAYRKLHDIDGAKFFVAGCSGEVLQIAPVANKEQSLLFGVAASHPDVRRAGPFVFRTYVDIEQGMDEVIGDMLRVKENRVAVLSDENAFTQGIRNILRSKLGDHIVSDIDYPSGETDFRTLLLRTKSAHPNELYLNCAGPTSCIALFRAASQLKISLPKFSYYYPEHPDVLRAVPGELEGTRFISVPDLASTTPLYSAVMERYLQKYGRGPDTSFISRSTFDALIAMVDGIEAKGPDPEGVRMFLATYKKDGALGVVQFDAEGDVVNLHFVLKEIRDGKVQRAAER